MHSPHYLKIQSKYIACVQTHNPNMIVAEVLSKHPYHIDALMTMAELFRHTGDHAQSQDFLERALFAMESAFHPHFSPQTFQYRLTAAGMPSPQMFLMDFSLDANKPLFVALNQHVQSLSKRGCHRAAFELVKLLFKLDLRDPCGALLRMDYVAIRADRCSWLLSFIEAFENVHCCDDDDGDTDGNGDGGGEAGKRSLSTMPSFCYGGALAAFLLELGEGESRKKSRDRGAAAERQGDDAKSADESLAIALCLCPGVLLKLLAKLPISTSDSEWPYAMTSPFFVAGNADCASPTLCHLSNIYVERSAVLWRGKPEQDFLKKAAVRVARAAENAPTTGGGSRCIGGLTVGAWAAAREASFPPSDVNEYAHLRVADFSDSASGNNQLHEAVPEIRMMLGVGAGEFDGEFED